MDKKVDFKCTFDSTTNLNKIKKMKGKCDNHTDIPVRMHCSLVVPNSMYKKFQQNSKRQCSTGSIEVESSILLLNLSANKNQTGSNCKHEEKNIRKSECSLSSSCKSSESSICANEYNQKKQSCSNCRHHKENKQVCSCKLCPCCRKATQKKKSEQNICFCDEISVPAIASVGPNLIEALKRELLSEMQKKSMNCETGFECCCICCAPKCKQPTNLCCCAPKSKQPKDLCCCAPKSEQPTDLCCCSPKSKQPTNLCCCYKCPYCCCKDNVSSEPVWNCYCQCSPTKNKEFDCCCQCSSNKSEEQCQPVQQCCCQYVPNKGNEICQPLCDWCCQCCVTKVEPPKVKYCCTCYPVKDNCQTECQCCCCPKKTIPKEPEACCFCYPCQPPNDDQCCKKPSQPAFSCCMCCTDNTNERSEFHCQPECPTSCCPCSSESLSNIKSKSCHMHNNTVKTRAYPSRYQNDNYNKNKNLIAHSSNRITSGSFQKCNQQNVSNVCKDVGDNNSIYSVTLNDSANDCKCNCPNSELGAQTCQKNKSMKRKTAGKSICSDMKADDESLKKNKCMREEIDCKTNKNKKNDNNRTPNITQRKADCAYNNGPPNTCPTKQTNSLKKNINSSTSVRRKSKPNTLNMLWSIKSKHSSACINYSSESLKNNNHSSVHTQRKSDDRCNNLPTSTLKGKCCCSTTERNSLKNNNHCPINIEREAVGGCNNLPPSTLKGKCCCSTTERNYLENSNQCTIDIKRVADDRRKNLPSSTLKCKCCCSTTEINCLENMDNSSIDTGRNSLLSNSRPTKKTNSLKKKHNSSNGVRRKSKPSCFKRLCCCSKKTTNSMESMNYSSRQSLKNKNQSPIYTQRKAKRNTLESNNHCSINIEKEANDGCNNLPPSTLNCKCCCSTTERNCLENNNHCPINIEREANDGCNNVPPSTLIGKCCCSTTERNSLENNNHCTVNIEREADDRCNNLPPRTLKCKCCCSTTERNSLENSNQCTIDIKREADDRRKNLPSSTLKCKCCCSTTERNCLENMDNSSIDTGRNSLLPNSRPTKKTNSLKKKHNSSIGVRRKSKPSCLKRLCCCSKSATNSLESMNYSSRQSLKSKNQSPIYTQRKAKRISLESNNHSPINIERGANDGCNNLPPSTLKCKCCCSTTERNSSENNNHCPINIERGANDECNNLPPSTLKCKCCCSTTERNSSENNNHCPINIEREANDGCNNVPPSTLKCKCCCSTTERNCLENNNHCPINIERGANDECNNLPPSTLKGKCCCSTAERNSLENNNHCTINIEREANDRCNNLPSSTLKCKCCCSTTERNCLEYMDNNSIDTGRNSLLSNSRPSKKTNSLKKKHNSSIGVRRKSKPSCLKRLCCCSKSATNSLESMNYSSRQSLKSKNQSPIYTQRKAKRISSESNNHSPINIERGANDGCNNLPPSTLKCKCCCSTTERNSSENNNHCPINIERGANDECNNLPPSTLKCKCCCSTTERNSSENNNHCPINIEREANDGCNNVPPSTLKCKCCCSTTERNCLENNNHCPINIERGANDECNNLPPSTLKGKCCCSTAERNSLENNNHCTINIEREANDRCNNLPSSTLKCKCCCSTTERNCLEYMDNNSIDTGRNSLLSNSRPSKKTNSLKKKHNSSIGVRRKSKPSCLKRLCCCSKSATNSLESMNYSSRQSLKSKNQSPIYTQRKAKRISSESNNHSPINIERGANDGCNNLPPSTLKGKCCCSTTERNCLENNNHCPINTETQADGRCKKCCCSSTERNSLENNNLKCNFCSTTERNCLENNNHCPINIEREANDGCNNLPPSTLKGKCCCSTAEKNSLENNNHCPVNIEREADDRCNNLPPSTLKGKCCCSTAEKNSLENNNHCPVNIKREADDRCNNLPPSTLKGKCCCSTAEKNSLENNNHCPVNIEREADDRCNNLPPSTLKGKCCCSTAEKNSLENNNHCPVNIKREADDRCNNLPPSTLKCKCCCSTAEKNSLENNNHCPVNTEREADDRCNNLPPSTLKCKCCCSTAEKNSLENNNHCPVNIEREADDRCNNLPPSTLKCKCCCSTAEKNSLENNNHCPVNIEREADDRCNNLPPDTLKCKCCGLTTERNCLENMDNNSIDTGRNSLPSNSRSTEKTNSLKKKHNSSVNVRRKSKPSALKRLCCCSKTNSLESMKYSSSESLKNKNQSPIYTQRKAERNSLENNNQCPINIEKETDDRCNCCCLNKPEPDMNKETEEINILQRECCCSTKENKDHSATNVEKEVEVISISLHDHNLINTINLPPNTCPAKETNSSESMNYSSDSLKNNNDSLIYTQSESDCIQNEVSHYILQYNCDCTGDHSLIHTKRESNDSFTNFSPNTRRTKEQDFLEKKNSSSRFERKSKSKHNSLKRLLCCSSKPKNSSESINYSSDSSKKKNHSPIFTQSEADVTPNNVPHKETNSWKNENQMRNLSSNTRRTKEANSLEKKSHSSSRFERKSKPNIFKRLCCSNKGKNSTDSLKNKNQSTIYTQSKADDTVYSQSETDVGSNCLPPKIEIEADSICEEQEMVLRFSCEECRSADSSVLDNEFDSAIQTGQSESELSISDMESKIKLCFRGNESPSNMAEEILKRLSSARGNCFNDLINNKECAAALLKTLTDICIQEVENRRSPLTSNSESFSSIRDATEPIINICGKESEIELQFTISKEILLKLLKINKQIAEEDSGHCTTPDSSSVDIEESEIKLEITAEECSTGYLVEPANLECECECPAYKGGFFQMQTETIEQLNSCLVFCESTNRVSSKRSEIGLLTSNDFYCPIRGNIVRSSKTEKFSVEDSNPNLQSSPEYKKNITFKDSQIQLANEIEKLLWECCSSKKNYNHAISDECDSLKGPIGLNQCSGINVSLEKPDIKLQKTTGKYILETPLALKKIKYNCYQQTKNCGCLNIDAQINCGKTAEYFDYFCPSNSQRDVCESLEKPNSPVNCKKQISVEEFGFDHQSILEECLFERESCAKLKGARTKCKTNKDLEESGVEPHNPANKFSLKYESCGPIQDDSCKFSKKQRICFKNISGDKPNISTEEPGIELLSTTSFICFIDSNINGCNGKPSDRKNRSLEGFNNCFSNSVKCKQDVGLKESGIEILNSKEKCPEYESSVGKMDSNYQILKKRKDLSAAPSSVCHFSTKLKADLNKSEVKLEDPAERCLTECESSIPIQDDSCRFSKKEETCLKMFPADKSNISVKLTGIELRSTARRYSLEYHATKDYSYLNSEQQKSSLRSSFDAFTEQRTEQKNTRGKCCSIENIDSKPEIDVQSVSDLCTTATESSDSTAECTDASSEMSFLQYPIINNNCKGSGIELRRTVGKYAFDCSQTSTNLKCKCCSPSKEFYSPCTKYQTNCKIPIAWKDCSKIAESQADLSSEKNLEYKLSCYSSSDAIKSLENSLESRRKKNTSNIITNTCKFNCLCTQSFGRTSAHVSHPLKPKLTRYSNCTYPSPPDFSSIHKKYKPPRKNCDRNNKKPSKPKHCKKSVPVHLQRSFSPIATLPSNCGSNLKHKMSFDGESFDKDCSVRVAVRIRPQISRELIDMCRICTTVIPGEPQIVLGTDKAFTFDFVFDANSNQGDIYMECVERLVEGALRGYNATVLAYGQTGSGKTFTMGTGFDREIDFDQQGIIPRAVGHIFAGIEEIQSRDCDENKSSDLEDAQFSVAVQFMELYNEDIIDLLDPYNKGRVCKIHEDGSGQISVTGVTIKPIHGPQDALKCLQQGALARTTASTQMNDQSSRSHALFTILIRRQRVINNGIGIPGEDLETLTSKFNFVDLAGSERLKRTGATGERAREGISINSGLLSLGNCISALGDKSKKATHIPYRDSKLTRLLQDSLGGNSQTLMIACVSPSDRDFMETLNTLKYANRARNIKNKVQLNQDQSSRTISQLRREIAALQLELLEYKQGKRLTDAEGNSSLSDTYHENALLMADNKRLQQRLKAMQETINVFTEKNVQLKLEHEMHGWSSSVDSDRSVTNMVAGYLSEIEKLQAKLIESEEMYQQLKKNTTAQNTPRGVAKGNAGYEDPDDLINLAKRGLEKDREMLMSRSLPGFQEDNCNNGDNPNESCESDETDDESDDKTNEIQADINDINSDIEMKSKLIEQLELSQQRMQLMRQHYEEKLTVLNCKIVNTQKERDEVLANMGPSQSNQPNDKIKKVRDEYERKINDMQRELKKLQQAEREHARQQREVKAQEAKLRNLRNELAELKSIKTRLIRKMTEQTNRHKEEDTRKIREIAQLRKEQRRQENTVKSLQAKMQAKDQILKRKTEEVSALRRSQRGSLSLKAAGRVVPKTDPYSFNSRVARQRWDNMSRAISRAARNKQVIVQLEKELERLINERETLSHDLASVRNRQKMSKNIELANEEDTIKSNLNYVQENIEHVQQAIMDFEETKETPTNNNTENLQVLIGNIRNVEEAKFLLERLTDSAIMFSCNSSLTQSRLMEHETLLKEAQQESGIQQQLLQHFLAQNNTVQISDLFESLNLGGTKLGSNLSGSQKSLISNGTYDIPSEGNMSGPSVVQQRLQSRSPSPTATVDLTYEKNSKIRRRTAQPQDLLFGDSEVTHNGEDVMTRSFTQPMSSHVHPLMRVPSAPGSLKQSLNSPVQAKKSNEPSLNVAAVPQSPRLSRRGVSNKSSSGLEDNDFNPTQSPPVYRRMISREDNNINSYSDVFSRLGAGTQDPTPGGSIQKATGKIRVGVPLHCTHTVLGHNNSVLSIKVDDNTLYTASADRTVKVWDLSKETAQHCLSTHPGPVVAVQNDRNTGLLFSASGPYVRVWDLRTSNTKPIKTFASSGQILSGNANITGVATGESPITALCIGESGNLYMAASDKVRIWDLQNMACVGKLSGGHQAAVMCITSWEGDGDDSTDFVATGSKDHYVKVFEVPRTGGVIYPVLNLEPPHYDGVQALAVARDAVGADAELFSGSRDSGIKRWDLKSGELKQSLNNAHKSWISGMAISGDILLSSCRGGIIRLWNVKNCENIAEMKTGLMINDIVASGQRVFTASSEGKVRIWRLTNALRRQCSMNNS